MKDTYFDYLYLHGLIEIFDTIDELSYSKKLELVRMVNENSRYANIVLTEYKEKYINYDRVNLTKIKRALKEIINKHEKNNKWIP